MYISKFTRHAALGVAAIIAMASTAAAQSKVLVVDRQRVVVESEVGKHVARQVEAISNTMTTELKTSASPMKSTSESLNAQLKGKTAEEQKAAINSRPDLQKQYVELLTTEQKVKQEAQVKQVEMQLTEQKAAVQIATKMQEVIEAIAKERSADVVLDSSNVIYGTPVDITDAVITRLNATLTRISVTRERLPRKAPPAK